ncbi:MAG: NAD(P)-binding domain-containing protein [Bacteroidia bacterium]|nr:NAD(P)-binding domain-containing protein [Bacteroidia bacterium]
MKKKILVMAQFPKSGLLELQDQFDLIYPEDFYFSESDLRWHIVDADGLLSVFTAPVSSELLQHARQLRIISNFGVGYNNIDLDYATARGIVVCNTPDSVTEPTAEMAMGLMIALMRRISETDRKLRSESGLKWGLMENLGSSLWGKTLGIIGMGRIGRALARRAVASGMKIIYYNRTRLDVAVEQQYGANLVSFNRLIQQSDVLTVNCPLTDDTHHLIGEKEILLMKDGIFIINTSRGAIIDERALVRNLSNGKIGGAGLDVFEEEPAISRELFLMDNIVLTPHNATGTIDARRDTTSEASANLIRFFNGRRDISIVNPIIWRS